jgi:hypothetical protein
MRGHLILILGMVCGLNATAWAVLSFYSAVDAQRTRDLEKLKSLSTELRTLGSELEDFRGQLRSQQNDLAIESMLEWRESQQASVSFQDQLRDLNERIPLAETALALQLTQSSAIAAPEESDIMISLHHETERLNLRLVDLKTQSLQLIQAQKELASNLRDQNQQFMENWWARENEIESQISRIKFLIQ